jgi:hypothetical protein
VVHLWIKRRAIVGVCFRFLVVGFNVGVEVHLALMLSCLSRVAFAIFSMPHNGRRLE